MMDTMDKIRELATVLNKETDALNEAIQRLEDQLAEAKVGVSLWIGFKTSAGDPWELGYGKHGDDWFITVRRPESDQYPGGDPIVLTSAPRLIRVEAASHLDELLHEIKNRLETLIKSVRTAKDSALMTGV